jgi:hypothetical protein
MIRGLKKLSKKELSLLNKEIYGKRILSFYSSDGSVLNTSSPTVLQLRKFFKTHKNVFALDGTLLKMPPSDNHRIYVYIQNHCISARMRGAIQEETMKLDDCIKQKVFERDGRVCKKCGSTDKLCIDHIFPVSRGGFTVLENLQVLCEKCNLQKSNKILDYGKT